MKKQFLIWGAVMVILLLSWSMPSCTYEQLEDPDGVCFETEVLPIFVSNCTHSGCHNSSDREAGYVLTDYTNIVKRGVKPGDYKGSELYKVLILPAGEEAMPQSPYDQLTSEQITTIALWIDQGAENTTCDPGVCDTSNVTYSGTVKPILETYCYGCHAGSLISGGIDYNTYSGVKVTVNDNSLLGSIRHSNGYSAMPQNGSKLSDCNIAKIEKWIALGAKND